MFSSELDRAKHPFSSRLHGIVLGSTISLAVAGPLLSARTTPYFLAVMMASFLLAAAMRGRLGDAVPRFGPVFNSLAAFLAYAAASAAWGIAPAQSFLAVALAILVALSSLALVQLFASESHADLLHMGEGLWAAFTFGLLYLAIEIACGQAIKIWLYNLIGLRQGQLSPPDYFVWSASKLVAISVDDLKRNMSVLVMFLWPSVLAMMGTLAKPRSVIIAFVSAALTLAVVLLASHGTSKLAILGGLCAFGGAYVIPRRIGPLVAWGWVIACIGVLPAALLAHRLDLHNSEQLENSTRHRIIIWNYTAEQVLKAPLLGVGARTTYVLGPRLEHTLRSGPDEQFRRTLSTHSHSVYLQTWFELGLIGATLLTLLGLAILQVIRALAVPLQRYAYATFVSAAIMAASSYGMWQIWFIAMFGLSAALFALGAELNCKRARPAAVSA
jgi:O-antigen ligase